MKHDKSRDHAAARRVCGTQPAQQANDHSPHPDRCCSRETRPVHRIRQNKHRHAPSGSGCAAGGGRSTYRGGGGCHGAPEWEWTGSCCPARSPSSGVHCGEAEQCTDGEGNSDSCNELCSSCYSHQADGSGPTGDGIGQSDQRCCDGSDRAAASAAGSGGCGADGTEGCQRARAPSQPPARTLLPRLRRRSRW